jgi:nitrate reductase / nitrite oxidoreductase, alpha subunit
MASAKGHEYFLKHYLGTHHNSVAEDLARDSVHEVEWRDDAPRGKMDLVVDLNFRMDTSALYSDIVLPAASWYEKADLNSTDLHSFIHPLSAAVPPCWESKSDWQIFKAIAEAVLGAGGDALPRAGRRHRDVAARPRHPGRDGAAGDPRLGPGEVAAVPGKTMPNLRVVNARLTGTSTTSSSRSARWSRQRPRRPRHAVRDRRRLRRGAGDAADVRWTGKTYPSLRQDEHVCDVILRFATVTNGELAYRSYKNMEAKVGLPLATWPRRHRGVRISYKDLQARPHRFVNSPMWSGLIENGRAYSPFTYNVECLVPWRTLTGPAALLPRSPRLPAVRRAPADVQAQAAADAVRRPDVQQGSGPTLMLNYLTPHGKWHIHSTYGDNQRMTTLSRGCRAAVDERKDAAATRRRRQRLGRGAQRQRRRGHAGRGERADPARHLHPVPLAGADLLGAQVAAARQPAGRRAQQPDPRAAQAQPDGRRLRPVHLPLQLLGPDRLQPRHHSGAQAARKKIDAVRREL